MRIDGLTSSGSTPTGQVVELSRTDLRNPDVHLSVPVRQKRHEMAVAGHRSGLLQSIEVRDRLKSCVSYGVSPEVLRALQARGLRQSPAQPATASSKTNLHLLRKVDRRPRRLAAGGLGDGALFPFSCPTRRFRLRIHASSSAARRVDRAHPVMQVTVDRHPLPLLPALDRGHVAFEVGRDLLPRIQPVFKRSRRMAVFQGMVRPSRSPDWSAVVTNPETRIVASLPARHGKTLHSTANRGNGCNSAPCRLKAPTTVSDCVRCVSSESQIWRSFMKSKAFAADGAHHHGPGGAGGKHWRVGSRSDI